MESKASQARQKFSTKQTLLFAGALGCFLSVFFAALPAFAQTTPGDLGLGQIQQTSGLGAEPFAVTVGKIIRIILSLLGVVTIVIVIYGGVQYMTASGNEEKVDTAKKWIYNGVIGLIIVLSAFAITQFILSRLVSATGAQLSLGEITNEGGGGAGGVGGFGTSGSQAFRVKSITPQGTTQFANVAVMVVFNDTIDDSTVQNNFKVTGPNGVVNGTTNVQGDTIFFTPNAACPSPNETRHCFNEKTLYTVSLTKDIISSVTKRALDCKNSICSAKFTTGTGVDTEAPVVSNVIPLNGVNVPIGGIVLTEGTGTDNAEIAWMRLIVDGVTLDTQSPALTAGNLPKSFTMESSRFSTKNDQPGKSHTIVFMALDTAGNSGSALVTVESVPASCFNSVLDEGETNIDCGGACGACASASCTESADCAGQMQCDPATHTCVSSPVITGVSPNAAGPGSYVTIAGSGFTSSTGSVVFFGSSDPADDAVAGLACTGAWDDTSVVIEIPSNAVSGPIGLSTTLNTSDRTDDANGAFLQSFTVNDVQMPGLCTITPESGQANKTQVMITGNTALNQSNVDRKILFGGYLAENPLWSVNSVSVFVPNLEPGQAGVQAIIKGLASNPLTFNVTETTSSLSAAGGAVPAITNVQPQSGPAGQYITITGTALGTTPSDIFFIPLDASGNLTALKIKAVFNFPQQCLQNYWTNDRILVKVPGAATGQYAIQFTPTGSTQALTFKTFTINSSPLGPQICRISPDNGPAKITLQIFGERFGSAFFSQNKQGVVYAPRTFVPSLTSNLFGVNTLYSTVPNSAETGNIKVVVAPQGMNLPETQSFNSCDTNPSWCSNPIGFTVQDCRTKADVCRSGSTCCNDGACRTSCEAVNITAAAYAWCFGTGGIACQSNFQPPAVAEDCPATVGSIPSPSPSSRWPSTDTQKACTNSLLVVKFTQPVDPKTVIINSGPQSTLYVEECTGTGTAPCATVDSKLIELNDLYVTSSTDAHYAGLIATPKNLKPNTTYRVTLTTNIEGRDTGLPLLTSGTCSVHGGAYCYTFTTVSATAQCVVDAISILPSSFIAQMLGAIRETPDSQNLQQWIPLPMPADHCQILDPNGYSWTWRPAVKEDAGHDKAVSLQPTAVKTTYSASSPTQTGQSVILSATELASKKIGTGTLQIRPGAPVVYEQCDPGGIISPTPLISREGGDNVCVNARIVFEFNQAVNPVSVNSGLDIRECIGTTKGKECDKLGSTFWNIGVSQHVISSPLPIRHIFNVIPQQNLKKNTIYFVEMKGVAGAGPYGLTMPQAPNCPTGDSYCFSFKTRDSDVPCPITSVSVIPSYFEAADIGVIYVDDEEQGVQVPMKFNAAAFGDDKCVYFADDVQWGWGVDAPHQANGVPWGPADESFLDQESGFNALTETSVQSPALLQASTQQLITGASEITVTFPSPKLESYIPQSCFGGMVCTNADMKLEFSVKMDPDTFATSSLSLYRCSSNDENDPCNLADSITHQWLKAEPVDENNPTTFTLDFALTGLFVPNTKYRIVLRPGIKSLAGKPWIELNYPEENPNSYSWTFVTAPQNGCPVDHVEVVPMSPEGTYPGQKEVFIATPFSAPDLCHPEGQELDREANNFTWSSSDINTAEIVVTSTVSSTWYRQSFELVGNGVVENGFQTAEIKAETASVSGTATYSMACMATSPSQCGNGTYPGDDKCCHLAPQIVETNPLNGETGVCRNTMVVAWVYDALDVSTVTTSSIAVGYKVADVSGCTNGVFIADSSTRQNKSFISRFITFARSLFGVPDATAAGEGFCFNTTSTPFTVKAVANDNYDGSASSTITINMLKALPSYKEIKIIYRGGDVSAPTTTPGIFTKKHVPLRPATGTSPDTILQFTTGDKLCEVNTVLIDPYTSIFTKLTSSSTLQSIAYSNQNNKLFAISKIPDVYDWAWLWFDGDVNIARIDDLVAPESVHVVAGGSSGETSIAAQAQITADTIFTDPQKPGVNTIGKTTAGSGQIIAALCEDPWPSPNDPLPFPFSLEPNNYNFSLWYCKTSGKTKLPALTFADDTLIDLSATSSLTTLQAFHLYDASVPSKGAIGFRVETNPEHLSPLDWFNARGFKGVPVKTSVDGFESVRSGNTLYISFANLPDTSPATSRGYTNILVVGLSEPATPEMKTIFDQIIDNLEFTKNLSSFDSGFCQLLTGQMTSSTCVSDAVCQGIGEGAVCSAPTLKLRRDTKRLADAKTMIRAANRIRALTGKYPSIVSGTFVPTLVSSKWPGWNTLMTQLGIIPVADPLNSYVECPSGYDSATCWNASQQLYQCSAGSYVYHYMSFENGNDFNVTLERELPGIQWQDPISLEPKIIPNYCRNLTSALSPNNVCGDGVLGVEEVCDPPNQVFNGYVTSTVSCQPFETLQATCNDTCSGVTQTKCAPQFVCGNGKREGLELCDDGKLNGQYNHCAADCGLTSGSAISVAGECGDGVVQKNETCDTAWPIGKKLMLAEYAWGVMCDSNIIGRPLTDNDVIDFSAASLNADSAILDAVKFDSTDGNPGDFDWNSVSDFCLGKIGDGDIGLCADSWKKCESNSDCRGGGTCRKSALIGVCENDSSVACRLDMSTRTCRNFGLGNCVRPFESKYNSEKTMSCNWDCKAYGPYCGDGIKNGNEQCDGNQVCIDPATKLAGTAFCSSQCMWTTPPVNNTPVCEQLQSGGVGTATISGCGDGVVNPSGGEECDSGTDQTKYPAGTDITKVAHLPGGTNGVSCVAPYGANNSCQYCSTSCKKAFVTGGYCGDGMRNGAELCDKTDTYSACDPLAFEYNSYSCTSSCTFAGGGNCLSCGDQSWIQSVNIQAGDGNVDITYVDPTLGWLPGWTAVRAFYVRPVGAIEISVNNLNEVDAKTSFTLPSDTETIQRFTNYKLDGGPVLPVGTKTACFKDQQHYYKLMASKNKLPGVFSANINNVLPLFGGAFSYDSAETIFNSFLQLNTAITTEIWPAGQDGDYRIVVEHTTPKMVPEMVITAQDDAIIGLPETSYDLLAIKNVSACLNNGWTDSENVRDTVPLVKVDTTEWLTGCNAGGPYAQVERAIAYDTNGNEKPSTLRTIYTLRRPYEDAGYYAALYQFKIVDFTGYGFAQSPVTVRVYYYENGGWRLAGTYNSSDAGAFIESGAWFSFYFKPIMDSDHLFGEQYAPERALFSGKYIPQEIVVPEGAVLPVQGEGVGIGEPI